jgi:hypothetical protein
VLRKEGHRAQADALEIEAAQERGEIRKQSDNQAYSKAKKAGPVDIGLTPKDIHDARKVRMQRKRSPASLERVCSSREGTASGRLAVRMGQGSLEGSAAFLGPLMRFLESAI